MFTSIKQKIFISHFILILVLLLGLSWKHYDSAVDFYLKNIVTFHTNSSASIVRTSSLSISGLNYGNIQLPSFVNEISSNKKLLYLNIIGKSDFTANKFDAIYYKDSKKVYRNLYPSNYVQELENKLLRFKQRLTDSNVDKIKINFLIDRTLDSLEEYKEYKKFMKKQNLKFESLIEKETPYYDFKTNQLHLSFKTNNKNSGLVYIIFDISEIREIKNQIIEDLLLESIISIVIAIIFLNILSNRIIGPLNKLSRFMSEDIRTLDVNKVPSLNEKNEIGFLANKIKKLLQNMQDKQKNTEIKAYTDGLTGINNRYKFDLLLEAEIKRVQRYGNPLCLAIIDIDKFKNFNDTFGHLIGDEVLIMLSNNIKENIRNTDVFARWGGEEFVLLFRETNIEDANNICNNLRLKINENKHPLAGSITASFGVTQYKKDDTAKSLLKRCDYALYKSKLNGRNRVSIN